MKKFLIITALLLFSLVFFSTPTWADELPQDYFVEGDFCYHVIGENEVEVVGIRKEVVQDYENNSGVWRFPGTIIHEDKRYTLTRIVDYEYQHKDDYSNKIKNGMTVNYCQPAPLYFLYEKNFEGVTDFSLYNPEKIIFPDTLTYIGEGAFSKMEGEIVFAKKYKCLVIGKQAFGGRIENFTIPEGCVEIGERALGQAKHVTFPNTLKTIGAGVIGPWTESVSIPKENRYFKIKDGILYSKDEKMLYAVSGKAPTNIVVSKKTTKLKKGAFAFSNVKTVTLNEKITTIPSCAFTQCKELEQVRITRQLRRIGYGAFSHCTNLKTVGSLTSLREVNRAAFWGDDNLTLRMPRNVSNVDKYAFTGTRYKTSFVIEYLDE